MPDQPEYEFDVFISYSSRDKAWVRGKLLPRLETAGLKVCIDFRDFQAGRNALLNMQDAVRRSRRSLLVISKDWFASEWTMFEGLLGRQGKPSGRESRTIPLLFRPCDFPEDADFIAALTHIDFTEGADFDIAWRQLLTAVGKPPESERRPPARRDSSPAAGRVGDRRSDAANLDTDLRDLVARGLLHHDTKEARFDLHPIVRRYAYDRLAAPDRAAAHVRLRDYFAAVPRPDKVKSLEDLAPVIELYHHTVRAGQFDEAWTLFRDRIWQTLYYQLGGYLVQIDLLRALFPGGEQPLPRLEDESDQAHALNELANAYSLSGQPRRAVPLYEQSNAIRERHGDKRNLAIGLGAVAYAACMPIGALRDAEANLRRRFALSREIKDEWHEAIGHQELGRLLAYRGVYHKSEMELATALKIKVWRENLQGHGVNSAHRALRELLTLREMELRQSQIANRKLAIPLARRALELADEDARTDRPNARDYIRSHWLLGAAHRVAGQHDEAERHLHEALERCRRINMVDHEANILIDLARLRAVTGAPDEARRLAEEALLITERSGYVLQGADAHLELSKLALDFYSVGPSCRSAQI
ncbi:MAG: toll/interleukin-1 receptor domain-containing protein [Verrucomicrobia bacterium]|nr:toll/interleukin-1 receptor domain-containing protein [Verrucomicrobiota bacterium]